MKNPQDVRAHLRIFLMNGADLVNSNVKNGAKYNYIKFKINKFNDYDYELTTNCSEIVQ